MKATATAPSNIAFTKYWGKKEGREGLRLPTNGSISMNLSNMLTTTTVEFVEGLTSDSFLLNGRATYDTELTKVTNHLDIIRQKAGVTLKARITSENSFPTGAGLSSSASGFAALTVAASKAVGLELPEKELSIIARQGSGSACRSIPDGFVEWQDGQTDEDSYAVSIFPENHWDIIDIVVVLGSNRKKIPTSEGMKLAQTSPLFKHRLSTMENKNILCKKYISEKNFTLFGELIEAEALEMHSMIMTSHPPIIYWIPETLEMMLLTQQWRKEGLEAYFTINTGHNIHLILQKKDEKTLVKKLDNLEKKYTYIINQPSKGAWINSQTLEV